MLILGHRIPPGAAAAVCLATAAIMLAACRPAQPASPGSPAGGGGKTGRPAAGPVPVKVAAAAIKPLPLELRTFGTVAAHVAVTVKPQITGQLLEVAIQPGQVVRKGDKLFAIDARPFEVARRQQEALLARDLVLAEDAQRQAALNDALLKSGVSADDDTKRSRAVAVALQAAVQADRANLEKTRLDLEYCTILAPLAGRCGDLLTREGSVLKINDTELVTISQITPVDVMVRVPQLQLPALRAALGRGRVPVRASIPGGRPVLVETGELTFIDSAVDAGTGTVAVKAAFANAQTNLWPGQYVEVVLTLDPEAQALVVPVPAVQTGQKGAFVFVVKPDQTVDMRPVVIGRTVDDDAVVLDGLAAGETVVTDGQLRLVPGATVTQGTARKPEAAEGKPQPPSPPASDKAAAGAGR